MRKGYMKKEKCHSVNLVVYHNIYSHIFPFTWETLREKQAGTPWAYSFFFTSPSLAVC